MKKLFFISILTFCANALCNAQERLYQANGYIIETRGKYVFQPCNDSTKDILTSLTKGSFELPLFDHHNDVITPDDLDPMWHDAKRFYGRLKYNACDSNGMEVRDSFTYYYCRIRLKINTGSIRNRMCLSKIISDGKSYEFNGLWCDNSIVRFEPLRDIDRQNFIQYINAKRRGYLTW